MLRKPIEKMTMSELQALVSYHLANAETFERAREPKMAVEFRGLAAKYQAELRKRFQ